MIHWTSETRVSKANSLCKAISKKYCFVVSTQPQDFISGQAGSWAFLSPNEKKDRWEVLFSPQEQNT